MAKKNWQAKFRQKKKTGRPKKYKKTGQKQANLKSQKTPNKKNWQTQIKKKIDKKLTNRGNIKKSAGKPSVSDLTGLKFAQKKVKLLKKNWQTKK